MLKKLVLIAVFASVAYPVHADNSQVNIRLKIRECKTFQAAWVGKKQFVFKSSMGGMLTVSDLSSSKRINLPQNIYVPNQGSVPYVGSVHNGLGYDFLEGHAILTLTSPKYLNYKFKFCNNEW